MLSKCEECGRTFGILYKKHKLSDGRIVCYECLENHLHDIVNKEEVRKKINIMVNLKKTK
jgi:protein-arginine kinase activator protein McsA